MRNEQEHHSSNAKPWDELLGNGESWRIDEPEFKATEYKETIVHGRPAKYSQCYELVEGKWEGFVSIRFMEVKDECQS